MINPLEKSLRKSITRTSITFSFLTLAIPLLSAFWRNLSDGVNFVSSLQNSIEESLSSGNIFLASLLFLLPSIVAMIINSISKIYFTIKEYMQMYNEKSLSLLGNLIEYREFKNDSQYYEVLIDAIKKKIDAGSALQNDAIHIISNFSFAYNRVYNVKDPAEVDKLHSNPKTFFENAEPRDLLNYYLMKLAIKTRSEISLTIIPDSRDKWENISLERQDFLRKAITGDTYRRYKAFRLAYDQTNEENKRPFSSILKDIRVDRHTAIDLVLIGWCACINVSPSYVDRKGIWINSPILGESYQKWIGNLHKERHQNSMKNFIGNNKILDDAIFTQQIFDDIFG